MSQNKGSPSGAERRRAKRRPILETFSLFVVVPKKGAHRLQVHDLSDLGIGFDLDIDGENFDEFPVKKGEPLDLLLYLNQTLYIPLKLQVARIEDGTVRRIGAEFTDKSSAPFKGYLSFLQMLDAVAEGAQIAG